MNAIGMQALKAIPEYDGFVVIEAEYQDASPVKPPGGGSGKGETESEADLTSDDWETVGVADTSLVFY